MQVIQQKSCIVEGTMVGWKDGQAKTVYPYKAPFCGGGGGLLLSNSTMYKCQNSVTGRKTCFHTENVKMYITEPLIVIAFNSLCCYNIPCS